MALFYIPPPGRIVVCDFRGFVSPEMIKQRPVVVISPKSYGHPELCTVVPLSNTAPNPIETHHYAFTSNPIPGRTNPTWAKCDMLATVSKGRLDRVKIGRNDYQIPAITMDELEGIRSCVRIFLGL